MNRGPLPNRADDSSHVRTAIRAAKPVRPLSCPPLATYAGNVKGHEPEDLIPPRPTLEALRRNAQECAGCDLFRSATQALLGEGPRQARAMFVGEHPGNEEDLAGR